MVLLLQVCTDLKKDVAVHKELLRDSEAHRGQLQVHITETAVHLHADTDAHRTYQEELLAELATLKGEIQSLRAYQSRREQDFLQQQEEVSLAHRARVEKLSREHHLQVSALADESQAKIERLQTDHHDRLTQVTLQHE